MSEYERQRLYTLRQLDILDTSPSEGFDRITRMAARLFDLPLAAVSLTDEDRQWFKSRVGTELTEVPRSRSPCSDISATSEVLVIEDFLATERYRNSPQARLGMRFYAGAPLTTQDGYTLGTLCVLGPEPRRASDEELDSLVDLSAMVMGQIELQHALGRVDPITLLPNRNQLAEDLDDLARDRPGVSHYAVAVELGSAPELDTMTRVMGTLQADTLARDGAHELKQKLARGQRIYCIGPCQYLFLSPARNGTRAADHARRLNRQLARVSGWTSLDILVRPAIGITCFDPTETAADEVIRLALSACQHARHHEVSVATYTASLDSAQQRSFRLMTDLHQALASDPRQLRLVFQPRIALDSGRCIGAEALLRWAHPTLGDIPPAEFIPLVDGTRLARPLTRWVLDSAARQAADWFQEGLDIRVSANVMACNFEEPNFARDVLDRLEQCQLPPTAFELELTESALVSRRRQVRKQLRTLANHGVHLAIDDFGTGYSNLAYLVNVPADVLKIDRVFTSTARSKRRESQETLLKAVIELAHTMGFRTVAEGFTPSSMQGLLTRLGCDEGQSFAISRPLTPGAFVDWYGERAAQFRDE